MNQQNLQAKKDSVAAITEAVKNSAAVVVVSYQGLTVAELSELREKLAGKEACLTVYKNTLVARALKDLGIEGMDEALNGPNAFVFSKDPSAGAAICNKFGRAHEHLVIKAGIVEGRVLNAKETIAVAKLPTKEVLLSMFCMVLNEPVAKFARTVKALAEKEDPSLAAN
ncbi:MAG: 50S ribosomal protein L10 [Bacilli bacterium]|nr:50S ribosomal protein L10 [Bacilli bacterium]